jgi:uncharacterized OB-fold protein
MPTSQPTPPPAGARPLADGLFTWPSDEPRLLGSRCERCATLSFPSQYGCPRCSSEAMTTVELGTRGRVWTWTSQEFRPPPPYAGAEEFVPYHVGYVELPDELIVETYLVGYDEGHPAIGDEVELTVVPFNLDDSDDQVVTYAFWPVARGTGS